MVPPWIGSIATYGDVAVLGHPHRVKAAVFELLREDIGTEPANVVQGQVAELHDQHCTPIQRDRLSNIQLEDPMRVGFAPLFQNPGNKLSDAEV